MGIIKFADLPASLRPTIKPVQIVGKPEGQQPFGPPAPSTARGATSHSYSKYVADMQDALRVAGTEMSYAPAIFKTKNQDSPNYSELLGIDPAAFNKLTELSKKVSKEGTPVGDGFWGQKTQDAVKAMYSVFEQGNKLLQEVGQKPEAMPDPDDMEKFKQVASFKSWDQIPKKALPFYAVAVGTVAGSFRALVDALHNSADEIVKKKEAEKKQQEAQQATQTKQQQAPDAATQQVSQQTEQKEPQSSQVDQKTEFRVNQIMQSYGKTAVWPFVQKNTVNVGAVGAFVAVLSRLAQDSIVGEYYAPYLTDSVQNVLRAINNWQTTASGTSAINGFVFDTGSPPFKAAGDFMNKYANKDNRKASEMLGNAADLCSYVRDLLIAISPLHPIPEFLSKTKGSSVQEQLSWANLLVEGLRSGSNSIIGV